MTELFETFDDAGRALGLKPRDQVHRQGFWHRSVNVFLFDGAGRLYLQRRAPGKDVGPGLWDLSVGEHLQPGESYERAAHRGLKEELSVEDVVLQAYPGEFRNKLEGAGVRDFEIQRCFHGHYTGTVLADPIEVAEVKVVTRAELGDALQDDPERFTPWLRRWVGDVDLLDSGWRG